MTTFGTTYVVRQVGAALIVAAKAEGGRAGADLRFSVGDLTSRTDHHLASRTLGATLLSAFNDCRDAGATVEGADQVRLVAFRTTPTTADARAVRAACIHLALAMSVQIITQMTFRSRDDVQALTARLNAMFAPAEDDAADAGDQEGYRSLVSMHAAITRDLVRRAKPLPQIVPFAFASRMPALALSNRLYGRADRADEIAGENRVVHPLFMPASGRALAV